MKSSTTWNGNAIAQSPREMSEFRDISNTSDIQFLMVYRTIIDVILHSFIICNDLWCQLPLIHLIGVRADHDQPEFHCSRSDSRYLEVHVATAGGWLTRYHPREVRNSIYRYRKINIDHQSKFLYRFISPISIIYGNTKAHWGLFNHRKCQASLSAHLRFKLKHKTHIDGLVQNWGNSSAITLELSKSCAKPSVSFWSEWSIQSFSLTNIFQLHYYLIVNKFKSV